MAGLLQLFLPQVQRFTHCHADLLLHQVHSHYFLRDRVLYLQAGVHLQKEETVVLVHKELDGARTYVTHSLGSSHSLLAHLTAQSGSEERRRTFFHNLLVAPLHGTFTFKEVDDVAVVVA